MKVVLCFRGIKQHECDNKIIQSFNHEMYLREVKTSTLSQSDVMKVILLACCKSKGKI